MFINEFLTSVSENRDQMMTNGIDRFFKCPATENQALLNFFDTVGFYRIFVSLILAVITLVPLIHLKIFISKLILSISAF